MKKIFVTVILGIIIINGSGVLACTGFTYANDDLVLVGNNEDYTLDCEPKINVYPPKNGDYGRVVFCNKPYPYVNMPYIEFGGMNEEGLFFDSFSHPYLLPTNPESKPVYNGWYIPNCLKRCSTVEEALEEFGQLYHPILDHNQILIVDRFGDSAIIEGDEIIRRTGDFQICTNFLQSHPELGGYPCWRYNTAIDMLGNINELSIDYFKDICNATHSEGIYSYTIYSNVYDLKNGVVCLYYMHDYTNVKIFDLSEEMALGTHSYYMSDLFNNENYSPDTPETPTGPSTGKINEEQSYYTSTNDPDKDSVYYCFDWGEGSDSGWLGPYNSGEEIETSHIWVEKGNYDIKVKAKDIYGSESEWSDPLCVSIPKNKLHKSIFIELNKNFPSLFLFFKHILKR